MHSLLWDTRTKEGESERASVGKSIDSAEAGLNNNVLEKANALDRDP